MTMIGPDAPLPAALRGGVVAIGNFDGVHVGHQDLLRRARARADARGIALVVLTFTPHPRRFFRPDCPPFLITPPSIQTERLKKCGVDGVVQVRFDRALSLLSPEAFITEILTERLRASDIVVGDDFHFGHDRAGSVDTLRAAGFSVLAVPLFIDAHGQAVSSTRVRGCLEEANLARAAELLGWQWFIRGLVVHGDARGRTLGYPTANIWLHDTVAPAHGIYAGWVTGPHLPRHRAAIALGRRPMFAVDQTLCEAHLLDFSGDLYDQILDIELVAKLRDESRFDSLEALIAQMKKDCDLAKELLG
jgi:riboflavin kinase/FMN adenylyltransferase